MGYSFSKTRTKSAAPVSVPARSPRQQQVTRRSAAATLPQRMHGLLPGQDGYAEQEDAEVAAIFDAPRTPYRPAPMPDLEAIWLEPPSIDTSPSPEFLAKMEEWRREGREHTERLLAPFKQMNRELEAEAAKRQHRWEMEERAAARKAARQPEPKPFLKPRSAADIAKEEAERQRISNENRRKHGLPTRAEWRSQDLSARLTDDDYRTYLVDENYDRRKAYLAKAAALRGRDRKNKAAYEKAAKVESEERRQTKALNAALDERIAVTQQKINEADVELAAAAQKRQSVLDLDAIAEFNAAISADITDRTEHIRATRKSLETEAVPSMFDLMAMAKGL